MRIRQRGGDLPSFHHVRLLPHDAGEVQRVDVERDGDEQSDEERRQLRPAFEGAANPVHRIVEPRSQFAADAFDVAAGALHDAVHHLFDLRILKIYLQSLLEFRKRGWPGRVRSGGCGQPRNIEQRGGKLCLVDIGRFVAERFILRAARVDHGMLVERLRQPIELRVVHQVLDAAKQRGGSGL